MKHNLRRVLQLTMARDFTVRAIRAWRNLLPDWTPTLDELRKLETMPHEHRAAVRVISEDWEANSPKWDVLMALLEWERREECKRVLTDLAKPEPQQNSATVTYLPEELWHDLMQDDFDYVEEPVSETDTQEPWDTYSGHSSDTPVADACPCGQCADTGCHHDPCLRPSDDERRERVVIPIKVVNRAGQVFHSGETTVETPLKSKLLDQLRPVKHLREKDHARLHPPYPRDNPRA